jgi:hypothetical protein
MFKEVVLSQTSAGLLPVSHNRHSGMFLAGIQNSSARWMPDQVRHDDPFMSRLM